MISWAPLAMISQQGEPGSAGALEERKTQRERQGGRERGIELGNLVSTV